MTDRPHSTTLAASPGPHRTARQTTRGLLAYLAVPVAVGLVLLALAAPLVLAGGLVGLACGLLGAVAFARRSAATTDHTADPARVPR